MMKKILLIVAFMAGAGWAVDAIYKLHQRSTTSALETDLQTREVGLAADKKNIVGKLADGTFVHAITKEMDTASLSGALKVTGAAEFSSTLKWSNYNAGSLPIFSTGGLIIEDPTNLAFNNTTKRLTATKLTIADSTILTAISAGRILTTSTSGLIAQDDIYWDATNKRLSIGTGAATASTNLDIKAANVAGAMTAQIYNTDNTSASSRAIQFIVTGGASSGDPLVNWGINGVKDWSAGIDNSDGDAWVLSESATLGTNNRLKVAAGGAVTIPGTLGVTGASTLTGNTTVGGTFGVTGATTLSSTLGVTGAVTVTSGSVTSKTTASTGLTFPLSAYNPGANDATGQAAGLLFSNEGVASNGKAAIVQERKNSFARGPIHILIDNTADNSNPDLTDAVATFHPNGNVSIGSTTDAGTGKLQVNGSISTGNEAYTYDEGSFPVTLTGFTAAPSGTAYFVRVGKMVTITWPTLSATSNSASMELNASTLIPASIRPATLTQSCPLVVVSNGTATIGNVFIDIDGTAGFGQGGSSANFSTTGTKGIGSGDSPSTTYMMQ